VHAPRKADCASLYWLHMRTVAISSLFAFAACFDPTFHNPTCGPSGACPPGWMCNAGIGEICTLAPMLDAPLPDAPVCPSTWHEVLANGNFEGGHTVWVEGPSGDTSICSLSQLTLKTKDGNYASCMGLRDTRNQNLSQQVALPPDTTRVRFQGYRCLVTSETDGNVDDVMTLRLTSTSDDTAVLADFGTWTNLDAMSTCRWDWFDTIVDLKSASPAAAMLRIASKTDTGHVTSWYLDVLSLQAFAPGPCPS